MTSTPNPDDVFTALGLLRDSLSSEEERIRCEGAKAMQAGGYDTATSVTDFAKRFLAFQNKGDGLVREWKELEALRDKASPAVQEIVSKRFFGKSKKGEITPHLDYCRPLLEVWEEREGSGKTKTVLNRLSEKIKPVLKLKDYEPCESDSPQIRWRNTAQGARN